MTEKLKLHLKDVPPSTIMMIMLKQYMKQWQALDRTHTTISRWPIIHFVQDMRILRAKHNLTKKFENDIKSLQTLNK